MKISKENYDCLCAIARQLQEDYDNDALNMNAMDIWYNLNEIINEIEEEK